MKREKFTNVIGDGYKAWSNTSVILDGGTGTGKTHFIIHVLAEFAATEKKTVLYLCNRTELCRQIYGELSEDLKSTVRVVTYQALAYQIIRDEPVPQYDYIVADECHYFTADANFNSYTEDAYRFVMAQDRQGSVVIYMSATASSFFRELLSENKVPQKNYFHIEKDYSYVDNLIFYKKNYLIPKIDAILDYEPDSKIIVFCNSIGRMKELYQKYGELAYYKASNSRLDVETICTNDCIYEHQDGRITFDKRLLVTTRVLDNGVNLIDPEIKHIFCEIADVDSTIQALGRKRSKNPSDTCNFYIKNYTGQALQGMCNGKNTQIRAARLFLEDRTSFWDEYASKRDELRKNEIFYLFKGLTGDRDAVEVNQMRLKKYETDVETYEQMRACGYQTFMKKHLGKQLSGKCKKAELYLEEKDPFLEYLKSIEGKWLYKEDRDEVLHMFKQIRVKLKKEGIHTFNGVLEDRYGKRYPCRFRNREKGQTAGRGLVDKRRKLPDGTENCNRGKAYWILD